MTKQGRLYGCIDVNFFDEYEHVPKLALFLFVEMILLSKRINADGILSRGQCQRLGYEDSEVLLNELLESGTELLPSLIIEAESKQNSFLLRGWSDWYEEARAIKDRSKTKQEAGRKGGLRSGEARRASSNTKQRVEAERSTVLEHRDRVETKTDTETKKQKPLSDPFGSDFENCWAAYPRKDGKKAAYDAYVARRRAGASDFDLLTSSLNYARACRDKESQFIKLGATFFGAKDWWKDFLNLTMTTVKAPGARIPPPTACKECGGSGWTEGPTGAVRCACGDAASA